MSVRPPKYQKELSLQSPILLDADYKRPKVEKMLAILRDAGLLRAPVGRVAIDIGCSRGLFARALSGHFETILGVDIDWNAVSMASEEDIERRACYLIGDSQALPLPDNSVDLVICNHVYEHVPSAERLFEEIRRVLRPGGICYLGAASKWTLVEPHYHLPFLSWLPKPIAHCYIRAAGKAEYYYENLRSLAGIEALIARFEVVDYTLRVVEDPDGFCARDLFPKGSRVEKVPLWVWRLFYRALPSYLLLLRKQGVPL